MKHDLLAGKETALKSYLHLRSLVETSGKAAEGLQTALSRLGTDVSMVTLDLHKTNHLLSEEDVVSLVEVIKAAWPRPACCLVHCQNVVAWNRVAACLTQPLLCWNTTVRCGGYQVLGQMPRGDSARLLRALCLRYEQATAEQISRDREVISQRTLHLDPHVLMEWMTKGRPPFGPTRADVARIARELHQMVRCRYLLETRPGYFSAILPQPPKRRTQ